MPVDSYPGVIEATPNVVHYWRFNETAGATSAADSTPNGGAVALPFSASGVTLGQPGVRSGTTAVAFGGTDGTPGYAGVGSAIGDLREGVTYETWYQTSNLTKLRQTVFSNGGENDGFALVLNGNDAVNGRIWVLEGMVAWNDTGVSFPADHDFHYLALRYAPYHWTLSLDGATVASGNFNSPYNGPSAFRVGSDGHYAFAGSIQDFVIYGRQLTDSEVAANYAAGRPSGSAVDVSASTGLALGTGVTVRLNSDVVVAAATGIAAGAVAGGSKYTPRVIDVSAATSLALAPAAHAARDWSLAAATGIGLAAAGAGLSNAKNVAVVTRINLGVGVGFRFTRTYLVAATTRLAVGSAARATATRSVSVSASTGLALGGSGRATRDVVAACQTRLELGAAGVKVGRDIHVAVVTGLGFATSNRTNAHPRADAASGFVVYVTAGAAVSGTPAETGLVLRDRADAVVQLPWRRSAPTLNPGGQLPH